MARDATIKKVIAVLALGASMVLISTSSASAFERCPCGSHDVGGGCLCYPGDAPGALAASKLAKKAKLSGADKAGHVAPVKKDPKVAKPPN